MSRRAVVPQLHRRYAACDSSPHGLDQPPFAADVHVSDKI